VVHHKSGDLRWWTFAGGVANTLMAHQLKRHGETQPDNASIRIGGTPSPNDVRDHLHSLSQQEIEPVSDPIAIEKLKFSETLPPALACDVFCSRFSDSEAIANVLREKIRCVSEAKA
jgi:hypothetical protein